MGRPTKYTPDTVKKITDALKIGATRKASSGAAGIDQVTFCRWMNDNVNFASVVMRAEHEAELKYTARIAREANAVDGDWRAAESWLKRRRREEWTEKVDTEVTGKVVHEHVNADEEAVLAAAEEIRFKRLIGDVGAVEPADVHASDVPGI